MFSYRQLAPALTTTTLSPPYGVGRIRCRVPRCLTTSTRVLLAETVLGIKPAADRTDTGADRTDVSELVARPETSLRTPDPQAGR